jgi:hypothetical protein
MCLNDKILFSQIALLTICARRWTLPKKGGFDVGMDGCFALDGALARGEGSAHGAGLCGEPCAREA